MLSDILHDVVVTIIVTGLGAICRFLLNAAKGNDSPISDSSYSPRLIKGQFWGSLFAFTLSLVVIFSISWEFSISWSLFLKAFALTLAPVSFILLWGAFDAAFAYTPDDGIKDPTSDREPEHGRDK